jgi:hypothetical protein
VGILSPASPAARPHLLRFMLALNVGDAEIDTATALLIEYRRP